jgi:hypothetical protein
VKPTIGRIVIYNHPNEGDVPAIVQRVMPENPELLALYAFTKFTPVYVWNISEGTGEGEWRWPERV